VRAHFVPVFLLRLTHRVPYYFAYFAFLWYYNQNITKKAAIPHIKH